MDYPAGLRRDKVVRVDTLILQCQGQTIHRIFESVGAWTASSGP